MERPYSEEKLTGSVYIRTFSVDTPEEDLKWHWDEEDRLVEPVGKTDWQFQFDNELPIGIYTQIHIPAGVIHRIIKGTNDLVVKITKINKI